MLLQVLILNIFPTYWFCKIIQIDLLLRVTLYRCSTSFYTGDHLVDYFSRRPRMNTARELDQWVRKIFFPKTILLLCEDFPINGWRIFLKTQIKIILTTIGDCDFSFEKIFTQFIYYNCNHWLIFIQNRYHSQFCTVKKITNSFFFNQVKKMKCSGATGLDISSFPEIKVGGKKKINEMMKKGGRGGSALSRFHF